MLLCVALVASFGVTSAFAITFTNADSAEMYWQAKLDKDTHVARLTASADMATEVEKIQYAFEMALWDAHVAGLVPGTPAYAAAEAAARSEAQLALKTLSATDAKAAAAVKNAAGYDVFDIDVLLANGNYSQLDGIIKNFNDKADDEQEDADYYEIYAKFYQKLADDEAKKAADKEAEETAAAAKKALEEKLVKGIDQSTDAGKLLADATIAKYYAGESMAAAKKLADAAKKTIAVAQKGAYTSAQTAILDAQAYAYNQMAAEITTAVNDYVVSVYDAINDFYAEGGFTGSWDY